MFVYLTRAYIVFAILTSSVFGEKNNVAADVELVRIPAGMVRCQHADGFVEFLAVDESGHVNYTSSRKRQASGSGILYYNEASDGMLDRHRRAALNLGITITETDDPIVFGQMLTAEIGSAPVGFDVIISHHRKRHRLRPSCPYGRRCFRSVL